MQNSLKLNYLNVIINVQFSVTNFERMCIHNRFPLVSSCSSETITNRQDIFKAVKAFSYSKMVQTILELTTVKI